MKKDAATKKRVFVGMSGGVDSSVAALLLKQQGYDVVGVYLKCWDGLPTQAGLLFRNTCNWKQERRDALRVAAKLEIPLVTYDFTAEYHDLVIDYFYREYEAGRTPNPDIMCNKEIKFGVFLKRALAEGADYVATGHYVRREAKQLCQAIDKNKDQSYFLWTLSPEQAQHCLFPLGELTKPEVRSLAKQAALPTAEKKDSQGICFIGSIHVTDFLRARIPEREGVVVTTAGQVVGEHQGAAFYTIGQRHGLRISSKLPYYVAEKDVGQNIITVAEGNGDAGLYQQTVRLHSTSWLRQPTVGAQYQARVRYRQSLQSGSFVELRESTAFFSFDEPQRAITEGQSCVVYDGEEMLGGGTIE